MRRRRRIPLRLVLFVIGAMLLLSPLIWWIAYPYFSFDEMFRRSKPALDAYAAQVMASGRVPTTAPQRLGYFRIVAIEPLPHGFLLRHDNLNPFDWNGLAYSTNPLPSEEKNAEGEVRQTLTPLGGDWYDVSRWRQ